MLEGVQVTFRNDEGERVRRVTGTRAGGSMSGMARFDARM